MNILLTCLNCLKFVNFFENLLLICPNLNLSHLEPCLSLKVSQKHYYRFCRICSLLDRSHCVKTVRIRSFSGPYFPAFGLNTEKYGVSLRVQSECGKKQTRKTPNTETLHAVSNIEIKKLMTVAKCDGTKNDSSLYFYAYCVKSVQNEEFFLFQIQENTDQKKLRIWTLFTFHFSLFTLF